MPAMITGIPRLLEPIEPKRMSFQRLQTQKKIPKHRRRCGLWKEGRYRHRLENGSEQICLGPPLFLSEAISGPQRHLLRLGRETRFFQFCMMSDPIILIRVFLDQNGDRVTMTFEGSIKGYEYYPNKA
jgi:hypothetical protein